MAETVSEPVTRPGLRRELRFLETASVSVGVMAPTLAMSVTGVAAAAALGAVSAATGVPRRALAAEMLIGLVLLTAFRLAGASAFNVFFYLATIGTLALVMYILTNVAAARHLGRRSPVQLVPAVAGVLIAGFVLYHNVWPVPPGPYQFLPYLVLGWLLAGLALAVMVPRSGPAPGHGSPLPRVTRRRACGKSPAGGS